MKFCAYRHFIYIIACVDEHKEELQSYYKITEEDLKEITKEWLADLLIPTNPVEMSDLELDISEAAHKEHDTPRTSRRKKTEEVQDLRSASEKTASVSPNRGGDDEVEEINGKEHE
jgi:predicted transcriptional regulator